MEELASSGVPLLPLPETVKIRLKLPSNLDNGGQLTRNTRRLQTTLGLDERQGAHESVRPLRGVLEGLGRAFHVSPGCTNLLDCSQRRVQKSGDSGCGPKNLGLFPA